MIYYGKRKGDTVRAAADVADYVVSLLNQALLVSNLTVPNDGEKKEWKAVSVKEGSRIKLTRRGAKVAGGEYAIAELFNFKFR